MKSARQHNPSPERGQAGLVLLVLSLLFISTLSILAYHTLTSRQEAERIVQARFESCVRPVVHETVLLTALRGGLPDARDGLRLAKDYTLPYWLDDGMLLIPSRDEVENAIASRIARELTRSCGDQVTFQAPPDVQVSLREDDVLVRIMPNAVSGTNRLTPLSIRSSYPLGRLYARAHQLMREVHAFRILENLSMLTLSMNHPLGLRMTCSRGAVDETRLLARLAAYARSVSVNGTPRAPPPAGERLTFSLPAASGLAVSFAPVSRYARLRVTGGPGFDRIETREGCAEGSLAWLSVSMPLIVQIDQPGLPVPFRFAMRMRFENTLQPPTRVGHDAFCVDVTPEPVRLRVERDDGLPLNGTLILSCPGGGSCEYAFENGVFSRPLPWRCEAFTLRVEADGTYALVKQFTREEFSLLDGMRFTLRRAPRYTIQTTGSCPGVLLAFQAEDAPYTLIPLTDDVFQPSRPGAWYFLLVKDGVDRERVRLPGSDALIRVNLDLACLGKPAVEVTG